jgi:hypothetical protein
MDRVSEKMSMPRRMQLLLFLCLFAGNLPAQDLAGIEIHGFATQGFLFSSNNNYLTMQSSSGSLQWTDGAVSVTDSLTENLRVGIQLHMYQLGQLGGPNLEVDWASGDYRVNDYFGIRAGKVKTPLGLFNDSQDIDAIFLWILLPQGAYPIDNKDFFLAHLGGEVYGALPLGNRAGKLLYLGYTGYNNLDTRGGYIQNLTEAGVTFKSPPGGKTYGGDLRWQAPLTGLILGASALVQALDGTSPTGGLHLPPAPVIAEYGQLSRGKFYVAGEYRRQITNATLTIGSVAIPSPSDERTWYVMGSYRLARKFQVGSYYSHYEEADDGSTSLPGNYSKDWAVSGRYDFNAYFYGKIEGHFLHGTDLGYYQTTNPNGLKDNSDILAAKIGFSF